MATKNYSDEEIEIITEMYARLGNEGLEEIAAAVDKPVRSVRAKLVKEGIYVALTKASQRKDGLTKKELLRKLENSVGDQIDVSHFMGATKEGISFLVKHFK